jgi:hypothetical protein
LYQPSSSVLWWQRRNAPSCPATALSLWPRLDAQQKGPVYHVVSDKKETFASSVCHSHHSKALDTQHRALQRLCRGRQDVNCVKFARNFFCNAYSCLTDGALFERKSGMDRVLPQGIPQWIQSTALHTIVKYTILRVLYGTVHYSDSTH